MSKNKLNRRRKEKSPYKKALDKHFYQKNEIRREADEKNYKAVRAIQEEHGVEPREKAKASIEEIIVMIGIVLDTGDGTTVIKIYANDHNKDDQWRKDIAKPKAGKLFEEALGSYSNHPVMIAIEKSHTYCKKTILKQTVTGALRMLSKHVKAYREIKAKEYENQQLKDKLAIKDSLAGKAPNWELAQQMRNQGDPIRSIADMLGVSKSAVAKNTKPNPK